MKSPFPHIHPSAISNVSAWLRTLPAAVLAGIAMLIVSSSAFAAQAIISKANTPAQHKTVIPAAQTVTSQKSYAEKIVSTPSSTPSSSSMQQSPSDDSAPIDAQPVTKYSISPDPRSTAYSITPPAANSASFDTTITHNGQVTPGTLISYNATKGDKTYYGGDFIFSTPAVTIQKSVSTTSAAFTISTPDGTAANEPTLPWYVSASNIGYWVSTATFEGPGTSWTMNIDITDSTLPGTYQVHVSSFRAGGGMDAWEYDGFITLNVEN